MILPKGSIVKYEPTKRGRERAVALIAQFPNDAQTVPRVPHHVELLCDFTVHPMTVQERRREFGARQSQHHAAE